MLSIKYYHIEQSGGALPEGQHAPEKLQKDTLAEVSKYVQLDEVAQREQQEIKEWKRDTAVDVQRMLQGIAQPLLESGLITEGNFVAELQQMRELITLIASPEGMERYRIDKKSIKDGLATLLQYEFSKESSPHYLGKLFSENISNAATDKQKDALSRFNEHLFFVKKRIQTRVFISENNINILTEHSQGTSHSLERILLPRVPFTLKETKGYINNKADAETLFELFVKELDTSTPIGSRRADDAYEQISLSTRSKIGFSPEVRRRLGGQDIGKQWGNSIELPIDNDRIIGEVHVDYLPTDHQLVFSWQETGVEDLLVVRIGQDK